MNLTIIILPLLYSTERVRQIQEKLEEFIHSLNNEKWVPNDYISIHKL